MSQLVIAILLYCNADQSTLNHKACRLEMMDCVLSETIIPKDQKLVQCIRQKDMKK
jgi:hypothetical protein